MKKTFVILSFLVLAFVTQCSENKQTKSDKTVVTTESDSIFHTAELAWLATNCFSCHHPLDENAIAPGMNQIKLAYQKQFQEKDSFLFGLYSFLQHPMAATSLMPEALNKFGLMPKMSVDSVALMEALTYIFQTDLDSKEWLASYGRAVQKNFDFGIKKTDKISLAREIAMSAKGELGKNLLAAIKAYGHAGAVSFCNQKALPITDSIASLYHVTIQRVSDKNRNPLNAASVEEIAHMDIFRKYLANRESIKPISVETEKSTNIYFPIETGNMCLNCHGDPKKDIELKTLQAIRVLYPSDKALGYTDASLRGMWRVSFAKP
jgi:hypothetical protein